MARTTLRALAALLVVAMAGHSAAGPVWDEGFVDAGSLPGLAQIVIGQGSLSRIIGNINGVGVAAGDFEDMFLIYIDDPNNFRATTDPRDPVLVDGSADFDTQLWLFRPDNLNPSIALGKLGNNDHPSSNPGSIFSLLLPVPTDGSPHLVEPGLYLLAISGKPNVPLSAGLPIFMLGAPTEISGPDGPGGPFPITAWANVGAATGHYSIALQGVQLVPACPWDCGGGVDKSVSVLDFLVLLGQWGLPGSCDFDGDGIVGVLDFLALLAHWGPCPVAANDECITKAEIRRTQPHGTLQVSFDMSAATPSPEPYTCLPGPPIHKDIWYGLTNASGQLKLVTISTTLPLTIEVRFGGTCPPGPILACGPSPTVPFPMPPITQVTIRLVNHLDLPNGQLTGRMFINNVPLPGDGR